MKQLAPVHASTPAATQTGTTDAGDAMSLRMVDGELKMPEPTWMPMTIASPLMKVRERGGGGDGGVLAVGDVPGSSGESSSGG